MAAQSKEDHGPVVQLLANAIAFVILSVFACFEMANSLYSSVNQAVNVIPAAVAATQEAAAIFPIQVSASFP